MKNLLDLSIEELKELVSPSFRAMQIYEWIYKKNATEFSQMLNLPKDMRQDLAEKFYLDPLKCVKFEQSSDGSIKYLFELKDGLKIESVLLPMKEEISDEDGKISRHARYTVCVSSQVGCKMGCAFCLTAKGGLVRNLTAGEIVGQILWIKRENNIPYERRINVVYMGMGEPLMNYNNVLKAIDKITSADGLGMSPKRITVSTSGVPKLIKKMADDEVKFKLAVSLHSAIKSVRTSIMPFNEQFPLEELREALQYWYQKTRNRITYEYVVWKDINDQRKDVEALIKFCKFAPSKVNLIEYNPIDDGDFQQAAPEALQLYQQLLEEAGITVTVRHSRGKDIDAACGQLANKGQSI